MKKIRVNVQKGYDIIIEKGLLDRTGALVSSLGLGKKAMICSDDTVAALYLDRLICSLEREGYECSSFVFEHGERSKCPETYLSLLDKLAENSFGRSDCIFALGGGVVGDLSGFAAATYMRGIRYVGIPTTLLAATDSSVGGKCAIDIPGGKNLVGAFWQPSAVIIDPALLDTLPDEYFSDGMAEVIKYAMIRDEALIPLIEGGKAKDNIEEVIERCVCVKRDVVEEDERDTGMRAILNFGHTVAHGIEAESGYTVSHGRAVGIGMHVICRACVTHGICSEDTMFLLRGLLRDYFLDCESPYTTKQLLARAMSDKKRDYDRISLVLITDVGKCEVRKTPIKKVEEMFYDGIGK